MEIKFKESPFYGILKKDGYFFVVSTKENPTKHDNKIAVIQAQKNGIDVNEDGSINFKVVFEKDNPFDNSNYVVDTTFCANYERDNSDPIVEKVRQKLLDRSTVGIKKYNSTIFDNIDENYIKHLQDELLDGANYCEQILRLGEFTKDVIEILQSDQNEMSVGNKIIKEYNKLKCK